MHSAPAVSYPVGRSHFQGGLLLCTGLTGMLAGGLWCAVPEPLGWRHGVYALTLLTAGVVAAHAWRQAPQGVLRWDGQFWHWRTEAAAVSGVIDVHLDFQFCLLLSLRTDAGDRQFLWPERRSEPTFWHALRCALFSPRHAALSAPAEAALGSQAS